MTIKVATRAAQIGEAKNARNNDLLRKSIEKQVIRNDNIKMQYKDIGCSLVCLALAVLNLQ